MKRQIGSFILALVAGMLLPHAVHAQAKAPSEPEKAFTADQLESRFNDILAKKLMAENICLSFGAARQLETIVRNAATEVVNSKKADALSLADKNFQRFATALIREGRKGSREGDLSQLAAGTGEGRITITTETIGEVLNGEIIKIATDHERKGLCPLFPICK